MWKIVIRDKKISAIAIYKDHYGRKLIAVGTDGTDQGRKDYKMIKTADISMRRAWGEFIVTNEMVDEFRKIKLEAETLYNGKLITMFLAENDDIIDYRTSLQYAPHTERTVITPIGGHRYDSEWNRIIDCLNELIMT